MTSVIAKRRESENISSPPQVGCLIKLGQTGILSVSTLTELQIVFRDVRTCHEDHSSSSSIRKQTHESQSPLSQVVFKRLLEHEGNDH